MGITSIEWTERSWNPLRGCTEVSPGCIHCYASDFACRFSGPGQPYEGLAYRDANGKAHWTGRLKMVPEKLSEPLKRKKPTTYFVNSMSDLFHEDVSDEFIEQVFAVMALTPWHTYQVLTKRTERLPRWFAERYQPATLEGLEALGLKKNYGLDPKDHHRPEWEDRQDRVIHKASSMLVGGPGDKIGDQERFWTEDGSAISTVQPWPLKNVWIGVSVENQKTADERIPHLLKTPAAVRFLSVEPLLGPVDLSRLWLPDRSGWWNTFDGRLTCKAKMDNGSEAWVETVDPVRGSVGWVIAGGESGPHARPCDRRWIYSILDQCKAAGVPAFVKQLGARSIIDGIVEHGNGSPAHLRLKDSHGGDPSEWPPDLRVREMPEAAHAS